MSNELKKQWKEDYFKVFATEFDNVEKLENNDKLKIEHFPPVIGKYYTTLNSDELKSILQGKLRLNKAKLSKNYNDSIVKIDYEKTIKSQLNSLMQDQLFKLKQEDPNFLKDDEKEVITNSDFPFIKLMTLVYSKDTGEMTEKDQKHWKKYMNQFINQRIIFGVINTYFTMKLYQDNNYTTVFQTPYNNEYIWNKYGNNQRGICITYDFKEITEKTVKQLKKLYPLLYVDKKVTNNDFDYEIYNAHCALLTKVDDDINDKDKEWVYIANHRFTETEYKSLDTLLKPVYDKTTSYPDLQNLVSKNYLEVVDSELEYDYKQIIEDITSILESEKFKEEIKDDFIKVLDITPDIIQIDYMKPEAIYLGKEFPKDKIDSYKEIAESEKVRIFQIRESDGVLFKAII